MLGTPAKGRATTRLTPVLMRGSGRWPRRSQLAAASTPASPMRPGNCWAVALK